MVRCSLIGKLLKTRGHKGCATLSKSSRWCMSLILILSHGDRVPGYPWYVHGSGNCAWHAEWLPSRHSHSLICTCCITFGQIWIAGCEYETRLDLWSLRSIVLCWKRQSHHGYFLSVLLYPIPERAYSTGGSAYHRLLKSIQMLLKLLASVFFGNFFF